MTVIKFVALLLVLSLSAITAQDCQVYFSQQQRSTWATDNDKYSLYDVLVQNNGDSAIGSLTVSTTSSFESFWEILSVGGSKYVLPEWRALAGGIPTDASHQFGYIIKGLQPAQFSVAACTPLLADASSSSADEPAAPTDAPTEAPTDAPTNKPTHTTAAPTEKHTSAPSTAAPTEKHTSAPTEKHTDAPSTAAPTSKHTSAPSTAAPTAKHTTPPTAAPTSKHTSAPSTSAPTAAPTTTHAPTAAPTTTSAGSESGQVCAAGTWWKPAPGTTWQWQLTGTIDTSLNVQMYDIDMFDSSTSTISTLHKAGRVVICYFSTQYENWRPDAASFTSAVLGNNLDDWAGEKYVDIRSSVVRNIMTSRMDIAVSKGCDGIEPDNVDGYEASTGFPLTAADQISFNTFIAQQAHARGLSVGLKNDVDQASTLQSQFDWALNEQCNEYSECDTLDSFITAGKAVFNCEYSGTASKVCPKMVTAKFSTLFKDLDLDASVAASCCTYASGGCVAAAHTCGSA